MDTNKKPLTIEEKLGLIRGRAVRFGLKRHDLEDAVQEVVLYLLEFTPDPAKANGASESTVLIGVIDRRLKQWLRTNQRYQDLVVRCGAMLPAADEQTSDGGTEVSDTAIDVAELLDVLPTFERQVGQLLSEGLSALSIARELGIGRRAVESAIARIREQFEQAGLGGEASA